MAASVDKQAGLVASLARRISWHESSGAALGLLRFLRLSRKMFVLKKKVSTEDALAQRWVLAQRVGMIVGYFAALRIAAFVVNR